MLLAGILFSFTVRGRTTHGVLTARDLPCGGLRRSPRHRQSLEHQHGLGPCYYPDREWSGAREMTYKTRRIGDDIPWPTDEMIGEASRRRLLLKVADSGAIPQ
ncbi:hypothetical protein EVAR_98628_1 [Eumeta japonica]|uniref:Uncharacterized protein n=1 Tax=Eumeta variegata TaxID=151549 RepID=A0A4C1XY20_EUMVA|nr:hypothetical protein EVAR_98628_1 [Eumeta japonica]